VKTRSLEAIILNDNQLMEPAMLQMQWTTLVAAIFAAVIVGGLLSRLFLKKEGQDRTGLRRQLDELKQQHQAYQINVTEHFGRTTDLIEELNSNYSKIQDHLNHGAEEFIRPEYRLESARSGQTSLEELAPAAAPVEDHSGPKDYAPKSPDQEGTLSETYGLKREEFFPEEEKPST
jgi:uncharacterized membrane-anchored protein YhcB (DUF1043 family)